MLHNINGINVAECRTLKGTSAWIMLMYVNMSMIYVCKYEGNVNHLMELWYKLEVGSNLSFQFSKLTKLTKFKIWNADFVL